MGRGLINGKGAYKWEGLINGREAYKWEGGL